MTAQSLTIAIEAAVAGGSLAVLAGSQVVGIWSGPEGVSKAEDLLFNIDELLRGHSCTINDVGHVAVSAGPGSFTGIRIGLATALGLKAGLGAVMTSISALEAMAISVGTDEGRVTAAVPVGRSAVCVQTFTGHAGERQAVAEPANMSVEEFRASIRDLNNSLVVHESLIPETAGPGVSIVTPNLAAVIGIAANSRRGTVTEPLFISKSS